VKASDRYERLLGFLYDKYQRSDTFRAYGDFPWPLADEFEAESGTGLGDGASQLEAFRFLHEKNWIGVSQTKVTAVSTVKLTPRGIEYVEQKRALSTRALGPAKGLAEVLGVFVKGFLGR
jgi:hypothetical protein